MPVIIEFSRCIGTYSSAKFELYRVIKQADAKDIDLQLNITPDVIAALESYGYKVIRPDVRDQAHDKEVNQHGND